VKAQPNSDTTDGKKPQLSENPKLQISKSIEASNSKSQSGRTRISPCVITTKAACRLELEKRWSQYEQNPSIALAPAQFWSLVKALKAGN